jgi:hypothetical protein
MDLKGSYKSELLDFILWLSHEYGFQDTFQLNKGIVKALLETPTNLQSDDILVNNMFISESYKND